MNLKVVFLTLSLTGLAAAGFLQYQLAQQVTQEAKRFVRYAQPWAAIRYQRQLPFLWGGGRVWGLSLEPRGDLRKALGLPSGYSIHADEVRVHRLVSYADGTPSLVQLSLMGLHLPVLETHSTRAIVNHNLFRAIPTFFEMQIAELNLDADVTLHFDASKQRLSADINALDPALGRLYLHSELATGRNIFSGDLSGLALHSLQLEYSDLGLAAQAMQFLAQRNHVAAESFEMAAITSVDQFAFLKGWQWSEASAQAVRHFIRDPAYARLTLAPVQSVTPQDLGQAAAGDWFTLLALSLISEGSFDHPPPGAALP